MRVLIISHLFLPDRGGGASVFSDLCFGLVERGHSVDVFSGYPYYPEWKNKSGANLWVTAEEHVAGVRLKRHGLFIPSNPSSLFQRLLYEISFTFSLMRSLLRGGRYDLVMVYCPLMGSVVFAAIRKCLLKERLWLNVQDIPADAAAASGISRNRVFNILASTVQRFLFRRADIVSSISPVMVRRLDEITGPRECSTIYFPNWLNATIEKCITSELQNVRTGETSIPRLLYAGNIGRKQGLDVFCATLRRASDAFHFRIFGDGAESQRLKDELKASNDGRFMSGPFLSEADFVSELVKADFFVITEVSEAGASFIPSKLIPCIRTGTPVIAICEPSGPLGSEVMEHNLGVVIPWSNLQELPPTLSRIGRKSAEYRMMSEACLSRAKCYSRSNALKLVERYADGDFSRTV